MSSAMAPVSGLRHLESPGFGTPVSHSCPIAPAEAVGMTELCAAAFLRNQMISLIPAGSQVRMLFS